MQRQNNTYEEDNRMAAAGAAAAIANAIKASGVIVHVDPMEFQNILRKIERPLIVWAESGIFSTKYRYLVSYKGLAFFTISAPQIVLPPSAETIKAKKIWAP
jgi:hypothetical protein